MTAAETVLWDEVRRSRLGFAVRRQVPIGPYFADFYVAPVRLVIELDGGYHAARRAYDRRRTEELERRGFAVIRYRNEDVLAAMGTVLRHLRLVVGARAVEINTKRARAITRFLEAV